MGLALGRSASPLAWTLLRICVNSSVACPEHEGADASLRRSSRTPQPNTAQLSLGQSEISCDASVV